ncbi:MAG: DUF721 domain-containing protein [Kiritimatiellae bacterium]|nr:DUF721 domain-containing protein [Kiritimatiellia bacterium]
MTTHRHDRSGGDRLGQSIGDVIPGVMKQLGLDKHLWEQAILSEWPALVGPQVAAHTRPGRIERGTLFVFVSHSTWLNELSRYGKTEMLANLQKRFGAEKIKSVRLQLDPDQHG